ncbi:MAG: STAS domain-containing protein [Acidobacteria bacterium]|nr:STAS domain-containing protein [Acidobacteriota bacterium]
MINLDKQEIPEKRGVIISVDGKIDTNGTEALREKIRESLDDVELRYVVINLAKCDFITSVGLGMLVGAHKKANAIGKKLAFVELHKNIESIFRITNLYTFFHVSSGPDQVWGE